MRLLRAVSQFFFHIRHDSTVFEDKRGGEFDDLRAAWTWALHDAQTLIAEGTLEGPVERYWTEIHHADGADVATLSFARVTSLN
jgi:hypothetical protein